MSTNLFVEPKTNSAKCLGKELKYLIAPIIWEHDGTLSGEEELITENTVIHDVSVYHFLKGIAKQKDEAGKQASKVLEIIEKTGGAWLSIHG